MKDIKVGIITFQRAHNYGAILQCYALQEILKSKNCDVEVVDYFPNSMRFYHYFQWKRFAPWHPICLLKNIFLFYYRVKRYKAFNDFIERRLNLSAPNILQSISQRYDVIVTGSDQLWNPKNSKGEYDEYYWGKYKAGHRPKIITYAVSMGKACNFVDWNIVKQLIANFDAISVREDYLKEAINKNCDRKVEVTLDPTLLQNREFWMDNSRVLQIVRPYLFFYQARANKAAYKYAKMCAKRMQLDFISLSADIMSENSSIAIAANPSDFLNLIRNASYVLTTSFHGTVFCYQFKKNFSTIKLADGDDGRSQSFLKIAGLEDRLISLNEEPNQSKVNWKVADRKIELVRNFSLDWLFNNITK